MLWTLLLPFKDIRHFITLCRIKRYCKFNKDVSYTNIFIMSVILTGYTQNNGAVSLYSQLKPHHSFVYILYIGNVKKHFL